MLNPQNTAGVLYFGSEQLSTCSSNSLTRSQSDHRRKFGQYLDVPGQCLARNSPWEYLAYIGHFQKGEVSVADVQLISGILCCSILDSL